MSDLVIKTAPIFLPLLKSKRYKGAKGGRGSGKSHFFAECVVELMLLNPNARVVCIREIQKSLKFSSKSVIEAKIKALGVSDYFEILTSEIRTKQGNGIIIFQGMQDHTADSIKSLEGFDVAWVEEAQNLSKRSLELLRPTIRKSGSELWFSWNPENENDPVDEFFKELAKNQSSDFVLVHSNFTDNPFLPGELLKEAEYDKLYNPSTFDHKWLGDYLILSDAQIFTNYEIKEYLPITQPYHGLDFGFANDETAGIRCYLENGIIYIDKELYKLNLELDDTANLLIKTIPNIEKFILRADSARPESISYLKRHGLPLIRGVKKRAGSVEDGISFIKNYKVLIHPDCINTAREFRLYSYKIDKRSADILPVPDDKFNHLIDALRYALEPLISQKLSPQKYTIKGYV